VANVIASVCSCPTGLSFAEPAVVSLADPEAISLADLAAVI
jgi:hypothetical protein